jgi:lipoyl-dependent peroxiredoxin
MADIERTSEATWTGDLRGGNGVMTSGSGVLSNTPYSFVTRFEQAPGTNPEELLAAAHAACYSMAFANTLNQKGYKPDHVTTHATCVLTPKTGGMQITKMRLRAEGQVPGLDQATFKQIADEVNQGCIVSRALGALEIEVEATLL